MIASPSILKVTQSNRQANQRESELRTLMRAMGKVLVAYSGGVDSTYLSYIANEELGSSALSVLGLSPSVSRYQFEESSRIAGELGLNFRTIETGEVNIPEYRANPTNRCYFCKSELYARLSSIAEAEQIGFVLDGTNSDDITDHRPGRVAAQERSVISPLAELGFSKADIRHMSRTYGLATWDKPASPCLSSRIAYGVPVTIERLSKVERGEAIIRAKGFREFRLRVDGDTARIEIAPDEMKRALDVAVSGTLADDIKMLGFQKVTLDPKGFRSGSMNEIVKLEKQSKLENR